MSSFYEDASLVMIPSGYKTSKVYCAKPTDGTGDLTFTRSNDTATRVNSSGLIEKVRTNIILQSNGFNTASWTKSGSGTGLAPVITANAGTAPDGTNNAFRVQFNCVGTTSSDRSILNQSITSVNSTPHTSSVYIKAFSAGEVGKQVRFITESNGSQIIITLTADWQRVINVGTSVATSLNFVIETRGGFTANTAADVLLAFAQLETGDIATAYIPTTTAAVSVGPVANVPRLDYLGGATCPSLLLEPQRTNLRTFSEQFSSLSPSGVTITSNDTISPDGYANADKITPSGSGYHTIGNIISATVGQKYTISVFYKYGTHKNIGFRDNNTSGAEITINMETNEYTLGSSVDSGGVVPYGNGWYRAYATFSAANANMVNWIIFRDNTNNGNYTADGSYSYFYGWQVEQGSYATSYIHTLGAAVTRGADACSKTGISSLIGQTEGTMFLDVVAQVDTAESQDFSISDGTASNRASIRLNNSGLINAIGVFGGSVQFSMGTGAYVTGQRYKIALAYKLNDVVLYVNGAQSATDTSATISGTLSRLGFDVNTTGTQNLKSRVNQALLFKTRLSNADLAALTTL